MLYLVYVQPQIHQATALGTATGELQRVPRVRADGERLRRTDAAGERGLALQPEAHETLPILLPFLEELLRARRAILGVVGEIDRIGLAIGVGHGPQLVDPERDLLHEFVRHRHGTFHIARRMDGGPYKDG